MSADVGCYIHQNQTGTRPDQAVCQARKLNALQNQELRDFIEMCFDPQAPVNKRLKEALFRIMEEGQEKT